MRLNLIFNSKQEYQKAKSFFSTDSGYYAEEDDIHRMLSFDVQDQADADSTEYSIEQEMVGQTDLQGYHWEIETDDDIDDYYKQNESKKAKMKTLIERIVKQGIAKKLNEAAASKEFCIIVHRNDRSREVVGTLEYLIDYFGYTLEKGASWQHERGNKRIDLNPKNINSLVKNLNNAEDNAAQNGSGSTYYEVGTVPNKVSESTNRPKRRLRLRESVKLDADLGNLDQYIITNFDKIVKNMEVYGWEPEDIENMTNYYDIAHLLGVDTRVIKDADLDYITRMAHGIINDINDEGDFHGQNESKQYKRKSKLRHLIELMVKQVISKKINESRLNESQYNRFASTRLNEETTEKAELDSLFTELVPNVGKAETIEGEMVRAMMRILYRCYNDGDIIGRGYGKETVDPSAKWLRSRRELRGIGNIFTQAVNAAVKGAKYEYSNGIRYKDYDTEAYYDIMQKAVKMVVNYVKSKNGNYTPNDEQDSRF